MPIWLSTENQFNYSSAWDIATKTTGGNLPIEFKFGNVTPVYYTFESIEDISDFYLSAAEFINTTLKAGWREKDTFNFSEYERLLNEEVVKEV